MPCLSGEKEMCREAWKGGLVNIFPLLKTSKADQPHPSSPHHNKARLHEYTIFAETELKGTLLDQAKLSSLVNKQIVLIEDPP